MASRGALGRGPSVGVALEHSQNFPGVSWLVRAPEGGRRSPPGKFSRELEGRSPSNKKSDIRRSAMRLRGVIFERFVSFDRAEVNLCDENGTPLDVVLFVGESATGKSAL